MFFPILLLAFILVPVIEIALLIKVGSAIGVGSTIAIVIFTAILGAWLVRQQGFATINAVQQELNAGRMPAMQMAEGMALLFAGAVLLTPGFVTDAIGFALLTPVLRRALIRWLVANADIQVQATQSFGQHSSAASSADAPRKRRPSDGSVIEGEYSERD